MMCLCEFGLNVFILIGVKIKISGFIYWGDIIIEVVIGVKSVLDILIMCLLS